MMRVGLRTQIVLSFLLVILLTVAAVSLFASRFTRQQFNIYVSETGREQAAMLTPLFAEYYEQHGGWEGVQTYVADLNQPPWRSLFASAESDGSPWQVWEEMHEGDFLEWGQRQLEDFPWQRALWLLASWREGSQILLADTQGVVIAGGSDEMLGERLTQTDLNRGASVVVSDRTVGTVIVATELDELNPAATAFLHHVNKGLLWVGLAAVVLALVLAWWLAGRLTAPARALTIAARDLAAGNWNQQLPIRSKDEFGQMTAAFNEMAAEVTRQSELRRRLVADVAHELRTPLSVLRLELEATQDGLQPPEEAVAHLSEELVLLERLVQDLGVLARADAGQLPVNLHPEDLGALVERVVERWQGRAGARGLALSAEVEPDLPPAHIDRLRVNQVLTNLLSNALRHTPEGGQVQVRCSQLDEAGQTWLLVAVEDTGEGIPPDLRPHVFERFYRTDPARGRETGGAGLGLSIARQTVELHGGRIWVESDGVPGQGSTFYFTVPVSLDSS